MADSFSALVDREVVREVGRHSRRLAQAQSKAKELRTARDALICHLRASGVPVGDLAKDAGVSRQAIYNAIRRTDG